MSKEPQPEPEWKGNSLHHVSVQASPIILYKDLKKKIAEIRVKRDAIMLAHKGNDELRVQEQPRDALGALVARVLTHA